MTVKNAKLLRQQTNPAEQARARALDGVSAQAKKIAPSVADTVFDDIAAAVERGEDPYPGIHPYHEGTNHHHDLAREVIVPMSDVLATFGSMPAPGAADRSKAVELIGAAIKRELVGRGFEVPSLTVTDTRESKTASTPPRMRVLVRDATLAAEYRRSGGLRQRLNPFSRSPKTDYTTFSA